MFQTVFSLALVFFFSICGTMIARTEDSTTHLGPSSLLLFVVGGVFVLFLFICLQAVSLT